MMRRFFSVSLAECLRDVFFVATFCGANLWLPAKTADEDELGHVGGTRRSG
jgi:hypothetical protein